MSVQNIEQSGHSETSPIAHDERVGPRLKLLRERRGISQRELARRAGVTNASVSQIEQDRVSPSVASLHKLASALGLSLAAFFSAENAPQPSPFQGAADLLEIGSGGVSLRLVGATVPERAIQMLHEHYAPGADSGPSMLVHAGEECGIVIRGEVEVTVGGVARVLRPGDAFYFGSTTPHRFRNIGPEMCEIVSASTPSTF